MRTLPILICCSGGVDSTALIQYYQDKGYKSIRGIHFNYGQPAQAGEVRALINIAKLYQIEIEWVDLRPTIAIEQNGEFIGRNALFVLAALNCFKQSSGLISLGIHAGSVYYDCSPLFVQQMQSILDGYVEGLIKLNAPFLQFSKGDIFSYCRAHKVPVALTYSCDRNAENPCNACPSCLERNLYDDSSKRIMPSEANQGT